MISDLEHLFRLLAKRQNHAGFFVDINNYRKERERIIAELAKAAARKAVMTKSEVRLPAMNAYERRLVHIELSIHPDVRTESEGEGQTRCVIIKPITES
jgi:spoIIIJ-associated protein